MVWHIDFTQLCIEAKYFKEYALKFGKPDKRGIIEFDIGKEIRKYPNWYIDADGIACCRLN